jgi:hypothetical protein
MGEENSENIAWSRGGCLGGSKVEDSNQMEQQK